MMPTLHKLLDRDFSRRVSLSTLLSVKGGVCVIDSVSLTVDGFFGAQILYPIFMHLSVVLTFEKNQSRLLKSLKSPIQNEKGRRHCLVPD